MRLNRRAFISATIRQVLALVASVCLPSLRAVASKNKMRFTGKKVLILGGGVGGMSAAHELLERGFTVTLVEQKAIVGGKARSFVAPHTGVAGRNDLPAEHGFRYFPGFCRHLPELMKRIPTVNGNVADHLVPTSETGFARSQASLAVTPNLTPTPLSQLGAYVKNIVTQKFGLTGVEASAFVKNIARYLVSCKERRLSEFEPLSWAQFVGIDGQSQKYQEYVGRGLTTSLQSGKPHTSSARTFAQYLTQLIFVFTGFTTTPNRVLDGPTQKVWFDPWLRHLRNLGLNYICETKVVAINDDDSGITSVSCAGAQGVFELSADYYIGALPVEVMKVLVTDKMRRQDPSLLQLGEIKVDWMNGAQYYLRAKVSLVKGHFSLLDSPWAITGISQTQFWRGVDLKSFGNGEVETILSVVISDWSRPGRFCGKKAKDCSREEILQEVWLELKDEFNGAGVDHLRDADLVGRFLDPAIEFSKTGTAANHEPIFITSPGCWKHRPEAVTRVARFYLAADYVKTDTDIASMESANEAARRAVNGIIEASRCGADHCPLYSLEEPAVFRVLQAEDRARFRMGLAPIEIDLS